MPVSSTRSAGIVFTSPFGEPMIAGPTHGWGHAGHPCASAGTFDLSPSLPCGGIYLRPPGSIAATPPTTGPTGTYGGANVGTGASVGITWVTIVDTFHRLYDFSNASVIDSNS